MTPLEEAPRLIDQVYKRLLDAISDHTLPPGSRIRQDELADRLRVSRQPISHALDGLAARLAASRAREDQAGARKLESALHQGRDITADTPLAELITLDVAFHQALYELSGNPAIEDTIGPQWPHMRRSMACVLSTPRYPLTVWEEHALITRRILAGDTDKAERAARSHALGAG